MKKLLTYYIFLLFVSVITSITATALVIAIFFEAKNLLYFFVMLGAIVTLLWICVIINAPKKEEIIQALSEDFKKTHFTKEEIHEYFEESKKQVAKCKTMVEITNKNYEKYLDMCDKEQENRT